MVKGCFPVAGSFGLSHRIWPEKKNEAYIPVEREKNGADGFNVRR